MEYLKRLRLLKDVSQQDVANFLGISRQAYSNYENGNRGPDTETLLKLAEYFEVTVDEILRGKEKAPTAGQGDERNEKRELAIQLTEDLTEAEMQQVQDYVAFLKSRRNQ